MNLQSFKSATSWKSNVGPSYMVRYGFIIGLGLGYILY